MSDVVAENRDDSRKSGVTCLSRRRKCDWTAARFGSAVAPFFLLPLAASLSLANAPRWLQMWSLAAALLFGLKWFTCVHAWCEGSRPTRTRLPAYFFAWPGTDAVSFFRPNQIVPKPSRHDWLMGTLNTAFGITLLLGSASGTKHLSPLLCGWIGMAGLAFTLHFGAFKLLALAWQSAGINARPLMLAPIKSTSLAEFWGRRWNTAFSDPARRHIFEPLAKRIGTMPASLAVFAVSGLLHEVVISLPAGAGNGLPTVYFLLQAIGVSFERSRAGRRLGLSHGWRGWTFVLIFTAGPVFWLFHPPFVLRVIFPFLEFVNQNERSVVMNLVILLQIAALLHIGLVCAGALMPSAVNLRLHLATLPVLIRRLFWVYYIFIGFVLVNFGLLTWLHAGPMAAGAPVARTLSTVLAAFWLMRCFVATFVFDVRPYLTTWFYRLGNYALNAVFVYLALVYSWAAWKGGVL